MTVQQIRVSLIWIKVTGFIIAGLLTIIFFVLKEVYLQNKVFQEESSHDRLMIKMSIIRHFPEETQNLFPEHKTRSIEFNKSDVDVILVPEDKNNIAAE